MERILGSAAATFERRLCNDVVSRLSAESVRRLDELAAEDTDASRSFLVELKADPGQLGLETLMNEIAILRRVRAIGLPVDLFAGYSEKVVESWRASGSSFRQRVPFRYTSKTGSWWQRCSLAPGAPADEVV